MPNGTFRELNSISFLVQFTYPLLLDLIGMVVFHSAPEEVLLTDRLRHCDRRTVAIPFCLPIISGEKKKWNEIIINWLLTEFLLEFIWCVRPICTDEFQDTIYMINMFCKVRASVDMLHADHLNCERMFQFIGKCRRIEIRAGHSILWIKKNFHSFVRFKCSKSFHWLKICDEECKWEQNATFVRNYLWQKFFLFHRRISVGWDIVS